VIDGATLGLLGGGDAEVTLAPPQAASVSESAIPKRNFF
jgi:hypothetical protein